MHDLDQVGLGRHDRIDIFVGSRCFVDDIGVLPALNPFGRPGVVFQGKLLLRLSARHRPSSSMRAGVKRRGVALAAHDIAANAHRAGNDAKITLAGADGTLSRDPDVCPVMVLLGAEMPSSYQMLMPCW